MRKSIEVYEGEVSDKSSWEVSDDYVCLYDLLQDIHRLEGKNVRITIETIEET